MSERLIAPPETFSANSHLDAAKDYQPRNQSRPKTGDAITAAACIAEATAVTFDSEQVSVDGPRR